MLVEMLVSCTETDSKGFMRKLHIGQKYKMPDKVAEKLISLGLAACAYADNSPPTYCHKDINPPTWEMK